MPAASCSRSNQIAGLGAGSSWPHVLRVELLSPWAEGQGEQVIGQVAQSLAILSDFRFSGISLPPFAICPWHQFQGL